MFFQQSISSKCYDLLIIFRMCKFCLFRSVIVPDLYFDIVFDRGWLTHQRRVTHICVSKLCHHGSDNGLSPVRRQPIIWTNDGLLSIRPQATHFNEILFEIQKFFIQERAYENVVCKIDGHLVSASMCFNKLHQQEGLEELGS